MPGRRVRWGRAFLLFAALWVPAVALFFYDDVLRGRAEGLALHERLEGERRVERRESWFSDCLVRNGVDAFRFMAKYRDECEREAQRECSSDLWCAKSLFVENCYRSKVPACGWTPTSPGASVDFEDANGQIRTEALLWYWNSSFSAPLKQALLVAVLPLILLPIVPALVTRAWRWLVPDHR